MMQKLIGSLSLCCLWNNNWVNEISFWESWLLLLNRRKSKPLKMSEIRTGKKLNSYTWEIANSVPTGNDIWNAKITSYIIID